MQVGVEEDQVDVALQVLQAPQPQQPPLLLVLARPPLEGQGQKEAQQPKPSSGCGFQQDKKLPLLPHSPPKQRRCCYACAQHPAPRQVGKLLQLSFVFIFSPPSQPCSWQDCEITPALGKDISSACTRRYLGRVDPDVASVSVPNPARSPEVGDGEGTTGLKTTSRIRATWPRRNDQ